MLACPLAEERKVRKRWAAAIRIAIEEYVTDDAVVNAIMACWATNSKGDIYDAVNDEDNDWCVPEIERVGESGWRFTPDSGRPPTFDPSIYWGANADTDDDDSDSDAPDNGVASLVTSKGNETYNVDWDRIESSVSPALAGTTVRPTLRSCPSL